MVKNLPAMQEPQVWSLDWEDPLEEDIATHSGILAWRIPWTEEPGGLQSMGLQRAEHDWVASTFTLGFPGPQKVKNQPAMCETQVWSLGREDPLEKEMATHSSILAWEIPWTEKPSGLQSMGLQRVGHYWETSTSG